MVIYLLLSPPSPVKVRSLTLVKTDHFEVKMVKMSALGLSALLTAVLLSTADAAVTGKPPRAWVWPGGLRLKDGKPVPSPLPRDTLPSLPSLRQRRLDMKERVRLYMDNLLTQELKLQMDHTHLEKFLTDMLIWRKTMFDTPRA